MKVPKHIRTALWEAQKHFRLALRQGSIIREWMDDIGLVDEYFDPVIKNSNITDSYIDTIEYGMGSVDNLIKEIEKDLKILKGVE